MSKAVSKEISISEILKPYLSKWWWFFLSVFVMLVLGILYTKMVAPVYNIRSSVLIKDAKKMSSASGDFGVLQSIGGLSSMGTNSIENEIEIFRSKKIIEDVIRKDNNQITLYTKNGLYDLELYKESSPISIFVINEKEADDSPKSKIDIAIDKDIITFSSKDWDVPIKSFFNKTISLPFANIIVTKNLGFKPKLLKNLDANHLKMTFTTFEDAVIDVQENLVIDLLDKDATVIGLSINAKNKNKGKDLLNNIVSEYNQYAVLDKNKESENTKKFIDDRIVIISKELGDVEDKKERYKSSNNIVDLPTEARINLQTKEGSRGKILELDTQLELQRILLNYVNSKGTQDVLPVNVGVANSEAAKGIQDYNQLVISRNKLLQNATSENPLVKEADSQIFAMKSAIKESLNKSITALNLAKSTAGIELGGSQGKISAIPAQEKVFRNIERQQQLKESLYLLLLQKREEAAISTAVTVEKARVVDFAYAVKKLVAPRKLIILAISLVIGLLIPFLYILLKSLFNNTITNKNDVAKLTDTKILVELPHLRKGENDTIHTNDITPLAEAFRILTTNFRFLLPKKESAKMVYVTSSIKGEGKTFVSVNLALSLANAKTKVLIIGADIRNPQLQRYNPAMKSVEGLTDYLYNPEMSIDKILHASTHNQYCDIIYSGTIPPNPTELLSNGNFKNLLDLLSSQYDYIIVDTAPIMLVTDTLLYSEYSDLVLYVLRSEVTETPIVEFANSVIEEGKLQNVGFIINDVSQNNFGYGNKYGYGYHADEKKWWQKWL